jgi:hypothetical protein
MQLLKVVLALAAVAFVPSEGVEVKAVAGQSLRQMIAARKRTAAPTTAAPTTAAPTTPTAAPTTAAPTTLNPTAEPTTPTAAPTAPPGCTCGCNNKCCCNTGPNANYVPGMCKTSYFGTTSFTYCISDYTIP